MYLMDEVAHSKWENKKTYTAILIAILTFVLAVLLFATPVFANPTARVDVPANLTTKHEAVLPNGEEFNMAITTTTETDENGNLQTKNHSNLVKTITFDFFGENNSYTVNSANIIDTATPEAVSNNVYLYRLTKTNGYEDLYILSNHKIYTDADASSLFANLTALTNVYFNNFNTTDATTMAKMFYNTTSLYELNLNGFETENVLDMNNMFFNCNAVYLDLNSFVTTKLTNMKQMFKCCSAGYIDMSSFDTHNVADMTEVFSNTSIYRIFATENLVLPNNDTCKDMFKYCRRLVGSYGSRWRDGTDTETFNLNISESNAHLDSPNNPGYFCDAIYKYPVSLPNGQEMNEILKGQNANDNRFVTSIVFDYYTSDSAYSVDGVNVISNIEPEQLFSDVYLYRVPSGENKCDVYILSKNTIYAPLDLSYMFRNIIETPTPEGSPFYYLKTITFNNFDSTATLFMNNMFYFCNNLTTINFNSFNTARVINMNEMFFDCYLLNNLDLINFNTSNVETADRMFKECRELTSADLSSFNTKKLVSLRGMFFMCYALEDVNLSNFDTFNTVDMGGMFADCENLTELHLESFSLNATNGKDLSSMFSGCEKLKAVYVSDVRFISQTNLDIIKLIKN